MWLLISLYSDTFSKLKIPRKGMAMAYYMSKSTTDVAALRKKKNTYNFIFANV